MKTIPSPFLLLAEGQEENCASEEQLISTLVFVDLHFVLCITWCFIFVFVL